jgi:hypothetical protein
VKRVTIGIVQAISLAMLVASCVSTADEPATDQQAQALTADPAAPVSTPDEADEPALVNSCKFVNFPTLHCSPGCCLVVNRVTGTTTCIDCE